MSGDGGGPLVHGRDDDYYAARHRAQDELEKKLYADFPEIAEAAKQANRPVLQLLCPHGHKLLSVTLETNHNWGLFVSPAEGMTFEAGTRVAHRADPLSRSAELRTEVCAEPGCGVLVEGAIYCAEHSTPEAGHDDTEGIRTTLVCPWPKCSYSGTHMQTTLLKLYATAIRYGLTQIRVPF